MDNSNYLKFYPYHGEGVTPSFQYEKKHQSIIDFFNKDARDCVEELISKAFTIKNGEEIVGYIAISFKGMDRKRFTRRKQGGKYARPALTIGQLIFDSRYQGKGYGTKTLWWVIYLVKLVKNILPIRILSVDAIDVEAMQFYRKRGFESLKDDPGSLILDLLPILKAK